MGAIIEQAQAFPNLLLLNLWHLNVLHVRTYTRQGSFTVITQTENALFVSMILLLGDYVFCSAKPIHADCHMVLSTAV
jgi:hypothetical protein